MVEEGGVEPPYIPATSKLPGNVARLVVNPDSFYPLKTKLMANIKYSFAQNAYLCTQIHVSLINLSLMALYVLEFQAEFQTVLPEEELKRQLYPVHLMLDGVTETFSRNIGIPKYSCSGEELCVPGLSAFRYSAVMQMGKSRLDILDRLLLSFQPLLRELLPSCTLRWNLKELHFSS